MTSPREDEAWGAPATLNVRERTEQSGRTQENGVPGPASHGNLDLDVFARLHDLTVGGMEASGYTPDYSQGWSAEAYPRELDFAATEGTVGHICPCRGR